LARILLYATVPIITKASAVLLAAVPEFDLFAACSDEQQRGGCPTTSLGCGVNSW